MFMDFSFDKLSMPHSILLRDYEAKIIFTLLYFLYKKFFLKNKLLGAEAEKGIRFICCWKMNATRTVLRTDGK